MTVYRFDANVAPGLPWSFEPETPSIELRVGETTTVFFRVKNLSQQSWSATAAYNVSPDQSRRLFRQDLLLLLLRADARPGEGAEWPVVFFLDPALEQDDTMNGRRRRHVVLHVLRVEIAGPAGRAGAAKPLKGAGR